MYLEEENSLFEAHGAVQFAWVDLVGFMYMDFLCCGVLSTRSGADFVLRDGKIIRHASQQSLDVCFRDIVSFNSTPFP